MLACVRNQPTCPLGVIEDVVAASGVEWRYVDAWSEPLPALTEVTGLIVLGGAMNADEVGAHPHLGPLRDLMGSAAREGVPVLGVCLGAQILARALGAAVYRAPKKEIGFVEVRATEAGTRDELVEPFAPRSLVFQFHEDAVELPAGAEPLFEGDDVSVQAFRYANKAYGIQFHLEVTEAEIARWCDDIADLETVWGATKDGLLDQAARCLPAQQEMGRATAERFLKLL